MIPKPPIVYFATSYREDEIQAIRATKPEYILVSFAIWQNKNLEGDLLQRIGYRPVILLDCGSFTFYNAGIDSGLQELYERCLAECPPYVSLDSFAKRAGFELMRSLIYKSDEEYTLFEKFITFIFMNSHAIDYIIAMDEIHEDENGLLTVTAYEAMRGYGLHTIPVFQYSHHPKVLERYVQDGNELICLGGSVGLSKAERVAWAEQIIRQYPDTKFHLLGTQSDYILDRLPGLYSCDGTKWLTTASFTENRAEGQSKVDKCIELIQQIQNSVRAWEVEELSSGDVPLAVVKQNNQACLVF